MDLSMIPHSPGVYLMRDRQGHILYVGKARDLAKRVSSYFLESIEHPAKIAALVATINHIDYVPAASEREALIIEQKLIHRLQPHFNAMWKDDKSYPHVKLTWKEDFPRLFLSRKISKDGSKYFGPYPNVTPIRRLLRYIWKTHMFPLRPCDFKFSEKNPLPLEKAKQCLYYHTKECPAPCVGRISRHDYRAIAKGAETFFKRNYKALIETWKEELSAASKAQNYERAAVLRDNVEALEHMAERVTVRQIELSDLGERIDRSRAITELQSALFLKRPPIRVECFDISHFQGTDTVASLVVFERGEPKKEDYRRFKIRTVSGVDDFASMGEVVGRRYRRLRDEGKTLPDLILIDGGKGQLSAAQTAIRKELDSSRIPPMAALAKQEEELFLPERGESVRLAKDSPALHLVQRVRDEAHRFAVTFHRLRRAKSFIQSSN
jgi:excinuclease ABC subunit C